MMQFKAALVGTGFMGWVHAEALRRLGVHIAGILGSSEEKSREAAAKLGIRRSYASLEEVLADDQVQVVHIGTPNHLHFEMARAALAAGKHVVCEKPLAIQADQSRALVELARSRPDLAAAVNYNIRGYPLCVEAGERIAAGLLGDVLHVTGCYVQDWLLRATDYNWRVLAEAAGPLRAVADIGTHWLDLVHAMTGLEVEAVCADLQTVHAERMRPLGEVETFQQSADDRSPPTTPIEIGTEDYGAILIRFRDGARGCLHVSQTTAGRKNALTVQVAGSRAALAWESEQPNQLWIGHRDQPNELLMRDPALLSPPAAESAQYPGGHNEGYGDSFRATFQRVYAWIAAGNPDAPRTFPTFEDGHREVILCDAILASHRRHEWVTL